MRCPAACKRSSHPAISPSVALARSSCLTLDSDVFRNSSPSREYAASASSNPAAASASAVSGLAMTAAIYTRFAASGSHSHSRNGVAAAVNTCRGRQPAVASSACIAAGVCL